MYSVVVFVLALFCVIGVSEGASPVSQQGVPKCIPPWKRHGIQTINTIGINIDTSWSSISTVHLNQ